MRKGVSVLRAAYSIARLGGVFLFRFLPVVVKWRQNFVEWRYRVQICEGACVARLKRSSPTQFSPLVAARAYRAKHFSRFSRRRKF